MKQENLFIPGQSRAQGQVVEALHPTATVSQFLGHKILGLWDVYSCGYLRVSGEAE